MTRTINVSGTDSTPPVITLDAQTNVDGDGRNDAADGTSVDILVGLPYTDAGATCSDDFDGNIPLGTVGTPGFTVSPDPATIDTGTPGTTTLTFSCTDTVGNGPTTATRDVNVIADTTAPVLTLGGAAQQTIPLNSSFTVNSPPTTCSDTNPIDTGSVDITANVQFSPATVDTSVAGDTVITFTCQDSAGNAATPVTQTITVFDPSQSQNFAIVSMTVTDVLDQTNALGQDGIAGCFKFDPSSQIDVACSGQASTTRFSSDGNATNTTIPGAGLDIDTGTGQPIGVRFGSYQPTPPTPSPDAITAQISPGFIYAGFPFVPLTFDPPSEAANPPSGYVSVSGGQPVAMTITSFPFGGAYQSPQANNFFLDPDEGTLSTLIFDDGDADPTTFAYRMVWSHLITSIEDPTAQFVNFTSQWRLEGIVKVDPTPITINHAPVIDSLGASQGAGPAQVIVTGDGPVTATVTASDADSDPLTYDWSGSDSRITPTSGSTSAAFVFDPSGLADGIYPLNVAVSDGTDITNGQLLLQVFATNPALGTGDTDGDGIPDNVEGVGDSDQDGIPDYLDPIDGTVDPTRNRVDYSNPALGDIVSDAGVMKLGNTAFADGRDTFTVTESDIRDVGGSGGTATTNYHDRLNDVTGLGHSGGGIFDWRVDGLGAGDTVCVVLPQAKVLPTAPIYRKYTASNGWRDFNVGASNQLASTMRVAGVCPGPGDGVWDNNAGLVAGDDCVRICVTDGGPNDADGSRNGSVSDPGTGAGNGPVPKSIKSSGGCVMDVTLSSNAAAARRVVVARRVPCLVGCHAQALAAQIALTAGSCKQDEAAVKSRPLLY